MALAGGRVLRVLVVEDDLDGAAIFAQYLAWRGHDVRLVHDGAAAVREADAFRPDAIVLDINLPEIDGWTVARRLRQNPEFGLRPLIVGVSAYGAEEHMVRSRAAGFDYHLVKPVDLELLDQVVRRAAAPPDDGGAQV